MNETWTCTDIGASSTQCTVVSTTTFRQYDGPNYNEWLFIVAVFLFILSFSLWREFFGWVNTLKKLK